MSDFDFDGWRRCLPAKSDIPHAHDKDHTNFDAGRIQEWFEGSTRTGSRSSIFYNRSAYLDGRAAATSPDAYRRWDPEAMAWMPEPDKNGGVKRAKASVQVPVVKIILTASCAELQCRGEGGRPAPLLNTIALDEIFERGELPLVDGREAQRIHHASPPRPPR